MGQRGKTRMARNISEERLEKIKPVKKAEEYTNSLNRFEQRKKEEAAKKAKEAKAKREAEKEAAKKAIGTHQPFKALLDLLKNS